MTKLAILLQILGIILGSVILIFALISTSVAQLNTLDGLDHQKNILSHTDTQEQERVVTDWLVYTSSQWNDKQITNPIEYKKHSASMELDYIDEPIKIPHTEIRMPLLNVQSDSTKLHSVYKALEKIEDSLLPSTLDPTDVQLTKKALFGVPYIFVAGHRTFTFSKKWLYSTFDASRHDFDPGLFRETDTEFFAPLEDGVILSDSHYIRFQRIPPGVSQIVAFHLLSLYRVANTQYSFVGSSVGKALFRHPVVQKMRFRNKVNNMYDPSQSASVEKKFKQIIKDMLSKNKNHRNCWQFTKEFMQVYLAYYKQCETKLDPQEYKQCIVIQFKHGLHQIYVNM